MNTQLYETSAGALHGHESGTNCPVDLFIRTILVVDDDQDDIFLLARAISPVIASCRFLTAANGIEAQGLLAKISSSGDVSLPAVIFSDLRMPRQDGFGLLEWIKRKPEYADIPVVVLSSFDNPADEERALALGAAACVRKPPEPKAMQRLTTSLMQGSLAEHHPTPWREMSARATTCAWLTAQEPVRKILLADDDPGVRETLGRVLESEHYQVIFAKNGNEAAAKSVSGQPDMVLLDLNMPDRDGWSAFRFMNAARPLLPVIVITARPSQYAQAEKLGVDALMEKPLNLPLLLKAIQDLLSETEMERTCRITDPHFKTALLGDRIYSSRKLGSR